MDNLKSPMNYIVYQHYNRVTGKSYIGISKQEVSKRWKNGDGYKRQSFNKIIEEYGWDSFDHSVLLEGLTKEEAEYFETFFIDYYDSCENGYNVSDGEGPINAMCGYVYREKGIVVKPNEVLSTYREYGAVDPDIVKLLKEIHCELQKKNNK